MSKDWKDRAPLDDFMANAIRDLVERGEFNNLPGKGKRQYFNENEMANPAALANRILKNGEFPPPWAALGDDINRDIERAEQEILRAHRNRQSALNQPRANTTVVEQQWTRALNAFRTHAADINKKILKFNIIVPPQLPHLHKAKYRVEETLKKLSIVV